MMKMKVEIADAYITLFRGFAESYFIQSSQNPCEVDTITFSILQMRH